MVQVENLKKQLLDLLENPYSFDDYLKKDYPRCVTIFREEEAIKEDQDYYNENEWDTNHVNIHACSVTYDPKQNIIIADVYTNQFDPSWLLNVYGAERMELIEANHYPPEWNEVYHIHLKEK